jgi:hypothetical protein
MLRRLQPLWDPSKITPVAHHAVDPHDLHHLTGHELGSRWA